MGGKSLEDLRNTPLLNSRLEAPKVLAVAINGALGYRLSITNKLRELLGAGSVGDYSAKSGIRRLRRLCK